jgi:hypothetical protein
VVGLRDGVRDGVGDAAFFEVERGVEVAALVARGVRAGVVVVGETVVEAVDDDGVPVELQAASTDTIPTTMARHRVRRIARLLMVLTVTAHTARPYVVRSRHTGHPRKVGT